jgi:hypothetical protein
MLRAPVATMKSAQHRPMSGKEAAMAIVRPGLLVLVLTIGGGGALAGATGDLAVTACHPRAAAVTDALERLAELDARIDRLEAAASAADLGWQQARLHQELALQHVSEFDPMTAAGLRAQIVAMDRASSPRGAAATDMAADRSVLAAVHAARAHLLESLATATSAMVAGCATDLHALTAGRD